MEPKKLNTQGFEEYLRHQKRYSEHTLVSYLCDLKQFSFFCQENEFPEIENIQDYKIVRRWIATLSDKEITPTTINRKLSSLSTYYKYLIRKNKTAINPVINAVRPKKSKKLPEFLTKESLEMLLGSNLFENTFSGTRDRLIIELFYLTGIRRNELIQLKFKNISTYNSTIKVLGKRDKERIIPITKAIINSYQKYFLHRDKLATGFDAVFLTKKGQPLYPKLVYNIVKKHLQTVSSAKKLSPHVLRHTFATYMLNNGADINAIKELLGHKSLAATEVYTHNTFEKLTKVYNQAHPRA